MATPTPRPKKPTPGVLQNHLETITELTNLLQRSNLGNPVDLKELYAETSSQAMFKHIYGAPRQVTIAIGDKTRELNIYPVMPKRWYYALDYAAQGLLSAEADQLLDHELKANKLTRATMDKLSVATWDRIGEADGLPAFIPPPPKATDLSKPSKHPVCFDQSLLTYTDKVLDYVSTSFQREDCGFRPPRLDGVAGTCKTQVNTLLSQMMGLPLVKVAGERSDPLTVQQKFGRSNDQLVTSLTKAAKALVDWGALSTRKAERTLLRKLAQRHSYTRLTDEDYAEIADLEGLKEGKPFSAPNEYAFAKQYGGFLFLDEINNFDPSIQTILNSELENRAPRIVHDGLTDRVRVHPNYVVTAAQNPASVTYEKRDPLAFDLASRMVTIPEVPAPTAQEISDLLFFKFTGVQPKVTINGVSKRFTPADLGLAAAPYQGMPVLRDVEPEALHAICDRVAKLHVIVYRESEQGQLNRMHQVEPTKEAEMRVSEPNAFSKRNLDDFCTSLHTNLVRSLQQHAPNGVASNIDLNKALVGSITQALHATYYIPNDFSKAVETDGNDQKRNSYISAAKFVEKAIEALQLDPPSLRDIFAGPAQEREVACLHAAIQAFPHASQDKVMRSAAAMASGMVIHDYPRTSAFILKDKAILVSPTERPPAQPTEAFMLRTHDFANPELIADLAEQLALDKETSHIFYAQNPGGSESTYTLTHEKGAWTAHFLWKTMMDINWINGKRVRDPSCAAALSTKDKVAYLGIKCHMVDLPGAQPLMGDVLADTSEHFIRIAQWARNPNLTNQAPLVEEPEENSIELA